MRLIFGKENFKFNLSVIMSFELSNYELEKKEGKNSEKSLFVRVKVIKQEGIGSKK
jgi:hypothetical protein